MPIGQHVMQMDTQTQTNASRAQQTKKNKILVFPGTRMVYVLGASSALFACSQTKVSIVVMQILLLILRVKLLPNIYLNTVQTGMILITEIIGISITLHQFKSKFVSLTSHHMKAFTQIVQMITPTHILNLIQTGMRSQLRDNNGMRSRLGVVNVQKTLMPLLMYIALQNTQINQASTLRPASIQKIRQEVKRMRFAMTEK